MKFLLTAVNAKYIHSNPAIYSLRAWCVQQQPELAEHIGLAEYTINQPAPEIIAGIYRSRPDVLAFSCYIWNWEMIQEIACELAKLLPDVPIWLGGPEVSYDPEEILRKLPFLTGIMVGEGEETFRELLCAYLEADKDRTEAAGKGPGCSQECREGKAAGRPEGCREEQAADCSEECWAGSREKGDWNVRLARIPGIVYRAKKEEEPVGEVVGRKAETGGEPVDHTGADGCRPGEVRALPELHRTPPRPLTDISDLPFFYNNRDISDFKDRIIYYESSRGCPYRCSYCLSSIDKSVRLRDISLVKKELQFFLDMRVPQVKFVDRTFNCNHAHAMAVWRYLKENDNGVTNFHFEIAADILTEEELELLGTLRPGLVQLEIGVQSTNPDTIREIRRVMDWTHLKKTVTALQEKQNIHIHLDLIAGLPLEGMESFQRSFNDVYSCRPEQLQLGFLKVLKGSYMHEKAEEYGIVYTDKPPYEVLFTRWLSYEELLRLKRVEEMVELYYNSGQFTHTLPVLETRFANPFEMYEALAEYVEEQGYFVKSPSRIQRYQILLDFAVRTDGERELIYRQLLTLDAYLRENMKSRPSFALPPLEDALTKKKIADFYRNEERDPVVLTEYVRAGYDSRQMARMTHLERFTFPVWEGGLGAAAQEAGASETAAEKTCWLLFDYQKRNPLNREARTVPLEL